jgi:hypothetical protein
MEPEMNKFDIKSYLSDRNIDYKTGGENVSSGWINISCLLPGCSDHKEHLGINLKTLFYSCWLCRQKGHAIRLVQIIEKCSERQAWQIVKPYITDFDGSIWEEEKTRLDIQTMSFPIGIEKEFPKPHIDYLLSRGFDPYPLIEKYKLKACWTAGNYRFRIIVPIFYQHQFVSFTAMDILRQDDRPKYKDCPINESIIPVKNCLYNIDSVQDRTIIFEGITGVWRWGDGAIASFTSFLTQEQILMLAKKKIKKVFILFDPDATEKGEKMAYQLSAIIPSVEQIKWKTGDPKDMSPEIMAELKKNLKF